MNDTNEYEFESGAVRISVPTQRRKAKVQPLAMDASLASREAGGFKPMRVVINFQIVDEDRPDSVLTEFEPAFELKVRFTPADVLTAQKANKPLALAFWNGSTWVQFTADKHSFRIEHDPKGGGGTGIALIRSWGDPNVAWGT